MKTDTPKRIQRYLAEYGRRYPSVWAQFAEFRKGRGTDLPRWPEWCWCPLAAAYSIVSGGGPNRITVQRNLMPEEFYQPNSLPNESAKGLDIGILGALAAWRMTQGIYAFDPDFFEALWTTEVGTLPIEIFYNLPEWCLYVEVPRDNPRRAEMLGWFVHFEWDVNTGRTELRLVLDLKDALVPVPIHLTHRTMNLCLKDAALESMRQAHAHGLAVPKQPPLVPELATRIAPIISVTLYIFARLPQKSRTGKEERTDPLGCVRRRSRADSGSFLRRGLPSGKWGIG